MRDGLTAAPQLLSLGLEGSGGITRCSAEAQVTAAEAFTECLCGHVQGHQAALAEPLSPALALQSPLARWQWAPGWATPLRWH